MNHYETLEVMQSASQADIKKAYRRLVKKYHPDINPNQDAVEKMVKINEAYELLSNAATKNLYDLYLQGVPVKTVLREQSSEDRYRSAYKMNRARKQRAAVAEQIIYTQKFYRGLRKVCIASLVFSIILALDYNTNTTYGFYMAEKVSLKDNETIVVLGQDFVLKADENLYTSYVSSESKRFKVRWSSILKIPINVGMSDEQKTYHIKRSVYIFGNTFSVIMFFTSLFIVGNKKYTDSRLTFGIISSLAMLWALGLIVIS